MGFRVGQKVVRTSFTPRQAVTWKVPRHAGIMPVVGCVYTVRQINEWSRGTLLLFEEIDNSHMVPTWGQIEPGFNALGFRPLTERSTDAGMSILRKILTDAEKEMV